MRDLPFGVLAFATMAVPLPVAAQALPEPVRAMIEEAVRRDDPAQVETVIALARATNPGAGAELATIQENYVRRHREETEREVQAQVDAIEDAGPLDLWRGRGELGAYRNTGNSTNTGITAGLSLTREGNDWEHRLRGRFDYLSNDADSRTQLLLAYRPRLTIDDGLFAFGLVQAEGDEQQGFDARYSLSGGLGYRLFDDETLKVALEAGPAVRHTEFVDSTVENHLSALSSLDMEWKLADSVKLAQDASAYVESANSTFTSITAFEAGMGGGLIARLSYAVEHDTAPPAGAKNTDTLSRFTVIYEF